MKLKNRSSFHAGFFLLFCLFSLCSSVRSCALMRTFIFFIYLLRFFIFIFIFFSFIYLPCAFFFYLLSPMRLLVLSSIWERGYLCFVCCSPAFSSISAFSYCFFFSCFTKAPFLLSPLSSFLFLAKRLHFFFLFLLCFLSKKRFTLRLTFLRVQLHFYFLRFLPFLSFIKSSVSAFSSFFLFSF